MRGRDPRTQDRVEVPPRQAVHDHPREVQQRVDHQHGHVGRVPEGAQEYVAWGLEVRVIVVECEAFFFWVVSVLIFTVLMSWNKNLQPGRVII